MSKNFFNTIKLNTTELQRANARAASQEELILNIFKANPSIKISPSEMLEIFRKKFNLYPPITSIRRGITNLTARGELVKTIDLVTGVYNLPEHRWALSGTTVTLNNFILTNTKEIVPLQLDLFPSGLDTPID